MYLQWDLARELLDALALQTMPAADFEVLFVNNGPPESVDLDDLPPNVRLLHCAIPGSYAARNAGAREARGEWLAFTDADCRPDPAWLAALVGAAEAEPGTLAAGDVQLVSRTGTPNAYESFDILRGVPQQRFVGWGFGVTANLLVARDVWTELGGFDATRFSGGDADFCRRAGAAGYAVRYAADAVVLHPARATWQDLKTQTRRIRAGHLTAGARGKRAVWFVRMLVAPFLASFRFMRNTRYPLRERLVASGVRLRLWGVELAEAFRLLVLRRSPERR